MAIDFLFFINSESISARERTGIFLIYASFISGLFFLIADE